MAKPRVSVCIPVYNLERYIAEALDSLKAQTYQDYEAIIVNDGSTDASEEVIAPYLDDPRFRYIRQENGGVARARETALAAAEGEWFAHLDGDDIWMPDKLELQIALADADSKTNMIYGDVIMFTEDGRETRVYSELPMPEGDLVTHLYANNVLATSSVMVKTADARAVGYPILPLGEDYTLWLRLARRGIWARAVKKPIVRYRIRQNSQVSAHTRNMQAQAVIMEEALSHEDRPHLARILRKGIRSIKSMDSYWRARTAAVTGDGDVEKLLWDAWRYKKSDVGRLILALLCLSSRVTHIGFGRNLALTKLRSLRSTWESQPQ